MRKSLLAKIVLFGFLFITSLPNQIYGVEKLQRAQSYKINYAVADAPAYHAFGLEAGNTLRPSSPEGFSAIMSGLMLDGRIMPRAFSAELAPFLLAHDKELTVEEYHQNATLYNSRISVGAFRDSVFDGFDRFSVGFRTNFIDEGDPKNSIKVVEHIAAFMADRDNKLNAYRDEFLSLNEFSMTDYNQDNEIRRRADVYAAKMLSKEVDREIEQLTENFRKNHWNAEILDFALALTAFRNHGHRNELGFDRFSVWLTYGFPLYDFSQFLIGGSLHSYTEDNNVYFNPGLATRMYIGSNEIKGYGELQYEFNQLQASNTFYFGVGSEVSLGRGFWFDAGLGGSNNISDNLLNLHSHFSLRYRLAESRTGQFGPGQ